MFDVNSGQKDHQEDRYSRDSRHNTKDNNQIALWPVEKEHRFPWGTSGFVAYPTQG